MKVLILVVCLVAFATAANVPDIVKKLAPSFTTGWVIKGADATPHSAPYIVSLSTSSTRHSHICGGTLIGKDWVLTAAHCISDPKGMSVIAGLHTRSQVDEKTQQRIVDFGKCHEGYLGKVGPYDICLLHVSTPFTLTKYVQIATLPAFEEIHSGATHLYGWGQTKALVLTAAKTLQTVESTIIDHETCKSVLPTTAPLEDTNICTDSQQKGISACNGDSGGPLVVEYEDAPSEVIGVVSWGYIPCGWANMPSIFTRVSAYIDWIHKIQYAYYVIH